jgi:hypothetical protein
MHAASVDPEPGSNSPKERTALRLRLFRGFDRSHIRVFWISATLQLSRCSPLRSTRNVSGAERGVWGFDSAPSNDPEVPSDGSARVPNGRRPGSPRPASDGRRRAEVEGRNPGVNLRHPTLDPACVHLVIRIRAGSASSRRAAPGGDSIRCSWEGSDQPHDHDGPQRGPGRRRSAPLHRRKPQI